MNPVETALTDYPVDAGVWDEMQGPDSLVRPHWRQFIDAFRGLGRDELKRRKQEAERLLRENGVTYNVHGDPDGRSRPWTLDVIPLILDPEDWRAIASGAAQRAELLNLILKDLYGPRTLIKSGRLPMSVVYSSPDFLRPCDGAPFPGDRPLQMYAADIVRDADGRFKVIQDRTQSPVGMGYALENRTVMARIMPQIFRQGKVRRLSRFFRAFRDGLPDLRPDAARPAMTVLLTPGVQTGAYFEHAYLASYLGYPLAQGDDLLVRDGKVWLKSLDGLLPVDIILRRLEDRYCDPLELAPDSVYGAAGLLEAVRRGNAAVINPLGAGILENSALPVFLPAIARELLGRDLILPSAAAWWCGDPEGLRYVLEHLDRLVIAGLHAPGGGPRAFGSMMSRNDLDDWRRRIQARPHLYVAQEQVEISAAPSFTGERIEPRRVILRSFAAAGRDGYRVLPGGLAHTGAERGEFVLTHRPSGGISKDVWVISARPERHISLWSQPGRLERTIRSAAVLTSRVAENLFWTGRYAERAESAARLLRTVLYHYNESDESSDETERACLGILLAGLTDITQTYPGFRGEDGAALLNAPDPELASLAGDADRPGSLAFCLRSLLRSAGSVRDRWSMDTWRVLNGLEDHLEQLSRIKGAGLAGVQGRLDQVITLLVAFMGLNVESMTYELGWRMLDAGRRVERGLCLVKVIETFLAPRRPEAETQMLLEAALVIEESLITYRRRYRSYWQVDTVLDLLLLDENNPRSLAYQMNVLAEHVRELPRDRTMSRLSPEERLLLDARTRLRLSEPERLAAPDDAGDIRRNLKDLLDRMTRAFVQTSDALTQTYFSHAMGPRQIRTALPVK